jgi:hypothetical protein
MEAIKVFLKGVRCVGYHRPSGQSIAESDLFRTCCHETKAKASATKSKSISSRAAGAARAPSDPITAPSKAAGNVAGPLSARRGESSSNRKLLTQGGITG